MKWIPLLALLALFVANLAVAQNLGEHRPAKTEPDVTPNVPLPRQGGDTIVEAFPVNLDIYDYYLDTGTTTGYTDNYDEVCPYSGSTSPDVVYALSTTYGENLDIDMCTSSYDTKIYVYDANLEVLACNDDFYFSDPCGVYVSKIENLWLPAGETYYLVIDGYGGDHGEYLLEIIEFHGDVVVCPPEGVPEGEPTLINEYADSFNGGCNSPEFGNPFQAISGDAQGEAVFCGMAGWYECDGSSCRDTDWFEVVMGPTGTIEVGADANATTYIFELSPQDCASVAVAQQIQVGNFSYDSMTVTGYAPGQVVWLWAGSTDYAPPYGSPPQEYLYVLWLSGLDPTVATEPTTWSSLKALYR